MQDDVVPTNKEIEVFHESILSLLDDDIMVIIALFHGIKLKNQLTVRR